MADNIIEAVDRLGDIASRLERIVFGDAQAHQPGLLAQVDALRTDMAAIHNEIQTAKHNRHNPWLLGAGFVTFIISGAFAMAAFWTMQEVREFFTMPAPLAVLLAGAFVVAAMLLFAAGLGLLRGS